MDGFELCLLSREIAEGRVYSMPVVVFLDVSEQIAPRFFVGRPLSLMDELHFERIKEAFHWRVVVIATDPADRRTGADRGELIDVCAGGVRLTHPVEHAMVCG
jgi:hypothetical protein